VLFRELPLLILDSALKHDLDREAISHALDMRPDEWEWEIDPDNDPPTMLWIGPDYAGNLLEVIGGDLVDVRLIWHAKKCGTAFRKKYLPSTPQS
jgi:hypothetical protein